jgi:hypothetical protein
VDERLAGFGRGREWDTLLPGPELAAVASAVAGPEWRCPGAGSEELIGVLRRLAALESWAAAARLGVIRELIRQDDHPSFNRPRHGDLPDEWSPSVDHELALAMAASVGSAERTAFLAWDLGARLPGINRLLTDGILTYGKAKLVSETFALLSDEDAAQAEALLIPELTGTTGKTFGQIAKLAARFAVQVDPGLAERRRKAAVKYAARVQMYREQSGAAALSGRDLPPDEALAANANVHARADQYRESGAFGDARMDQLRATAYLDLLNNVPAWERIACGQLIAEPTSLDLTPQQPQHDDPDDGDPDDGDPDDGDPDDDDPGNRGSDDAPDNDSGPGIGPGGRPVASRQPPRPQNLVLPLVTLLGLAERPGEAHGFGILDPDLCRSLAALAIVSPHTQLCITVTDPEGIAIGHGCARSGKRAGATPASQLVALPARINLTITAGCLTRLLAGAVSLGTAGWALAAADTHHRPGSPSPPGDPDRPDSPCPPGDTNWCGSWVLTLPGGLEFAVRLEPVPTFQCDHRHESNGYEPNDKLRHLVQIRDYLCTFPPCSRHARESDFEHGRPFGKGGRTCACNAGARSRRCHRIKQSPGWNVTQPRPGWHEWTTPSGRIYTQAPYRYPA